jgi:phosphoribosylformylglycinamidine synthase
LPCRGWDSPVHRCPPGQTVRLTVEGEVTDEVLAAAREAAETMLSNPVIEDVVSVRSESNEVASRATAE